MKSRRPALWLLSFAAVAPLAACNNGNGTKPAPSASASVAAIAPSASVPSPADKLRGPRRGPGHGGVDSILFRAARELPLTDDVKAKLDAIEEQLPDHDTDPRDAMKAFSTDLAAQVRAGKVEAAKLQPDEAALDAAMKGMLDKQATALAGLHDALDAGQRKALVDAVQAKAAARDAMSAGHDAGSPSDWVARRLDKMTSDYGLDATQQKQVGALLAKQPSVAAMRDDMKKQIDAVLVAFAADSFDAAKALQPTVKAPRDGMDRQIAFTGQLVAVLHADQREKLATSTAMPPGRGGPGGMPDDETRGGTGNGGPGRGGGGGGNGN